MGDKRCGVLSAYVQLHGVRPANHEFCLFPSLEAAMAGAERLSRGEAEPGDYYVIEVLQAPDECHPTTR